VIRFILNEKEISTDLPPGMVLLDFIRYQQHLTGTKIGCREGDCGACTVLVGEFKNGKLEYQSATCCLMPLGNAHCKHIVTIEGINPAEAGELNPIQQAMADAGATQCGFCTPGFVMSLAGFCLSDKEPTRQNAVAAIDGNICRCTGYKSIERAAECIVEIMKEKKDRDAPQFVAVEKILPGYFASIKEQLSAIISKTDGELSYAKENAQLVGGGTDLYVQKHDEIKDIPIRFMFDQPGLNSIIQEGNKCIVGPSATVSDLKESPIINKVFPEFHRYAKLVSSTPIRNMATIAGNFINASPIGDLTIFFLALDTQLILNNGETKRELPLRKLYKGYKQLAKTQEEYVEKIWFELPGKSTLFNFEKVSKRTHLDIASVNSAISISMNGDMIKNAGISAGGIAPVPMYLEKTSEFFKGKLISEELIHEAIDIAQTEISPISDARGTKEYKRLLLGQLIRAHFITLFTKLKIEKLLTT
jgi:xanthine dehydrogenase small subunit